MKNRVSWIAVSILFLISSVIMCNKPTHPVKTEQYKKQQNGFEALVKGIHILGSPNAIPGPIVPDSNWINIAFCPSFYKDGLIKKPGIFAAARVYKDGRVFAMGHEAYFGPDLDEADNRRFAQNVLQWLGVSNKKQICIRRTQWSPGIESGILQELNKTEYTFHYVRKEDELTENDLKDCNILIYATRWNPVSDKEIELVITFIKNGGGALLTGLGWSYKSYINQDIKEFPMNKIAVPLGLMFEDGFLYDPEHNYGNKPEHPVIHYLYPESPDSFRQP